MTLYLTVAFLLQIRDIRPATLFRKTFQTNDKITDLIALHKKLVYEERSTFDFLMIDYIKLSKSLSALRTRTHIFENEEYEQAFALDSIWAC